MPGHRMGARLKDVTAAAIGAFDMPLLFQIEVYFGMTKRPTATVTGDLDIFDFKGLGLKLGHDRLSLLAMRRLDDTHRAPSRNHA